MHTCAYPSHPRKFTYFVSGEKRQTGVAAAGFQHNNTITVKYDRTTSQANVRKIIETRKKKNNPSPILFVWSVSTAVVFASAREDHWRRFFFSTRLRHSCIDAVIASMPVECRSICHGVTWNYTSFFRYMYREYCLAIVVKQYYYFVETIGIGRLRCRFSSVSVAAFPFCVGHNHLLIERLWFGFYVSLWSILFL